ncbi:hypothetical protein [Pseudoxanthobacter sp.]
MHVNFDPALARVAAADEDGARLAALTARFWPVLMAAVVGLMLYLRQVAA